MKVLAVLFVCMTFLSGCSSVQSDRNPRVDLSRLKRFYVEHRLSDNHQVDETIVAELRKRGFEASAGPLTMMPQETDALVTYQDEWAWDFKSYLFQLHIEIGNPHKNQRYAYGTFRQPTPVPKPLPEVVSLLFAQMLNQR